MGKQINSLHAGHRSRLRQRFLSQSIEGFEPHNILELLLFYGIPYRDTNDIAHKLIDKFGSLEAVFDADIKELMTVDGIGENSATLIKLVPQISKYYLSLKSKNKIEFAGLDDIAEFMRQRYLFEEREIFTALYLDSAGKLISFNKIAEGTANFVDINIAKVIEITLSKNASKVIIAHNHPGGNLSPSTSDLHATNHLSDAFTMLHLEFIDHLIITRDDYLSLAKHTEYSRYFKSK